MQSIAQANIDRFNLLLKTETDPTKRAMMMRLLVEEEEKWKAATKPQSEMIFINASPGRANTFF
jgi:hypothetical protein